MQLKMRVESLTFTFAWSMLYHEINQKYERCPGFPPSLWGKSSWGTEETVLN